MTGSLRGRTVQIEPGDEIAAELMLHPSFLEDNYTRPAELVALRDALALTSPGHHVDQAGDFDLKNRREHLGKIRAKQRAEAAAWRRDRDDPVGVALREAKRRVDEMIRERIWGRLPCGVLVGVKRPRERNWPGPGDPDPTQFREEQRLRDLADQIEVGPVVRSDHSPIRLGRPGFGDEIDAEVSVLRQQADTIKLKRGSPYV